MKNRATTIALFSTLFVVPWTVSAQQVECDNPAGHCTVTSTTSECICADGQGASSGSAGEGEPLPELTQEELLELCQSELEAFCGTEAPDIGEYCSEEQLATCSEYLPVLMEAMETCEFDDSVETSSDEQVDTAAEPPEGTSAMPPVEPGSPEEFQALAECCEALEEDAALFEEFMDCIGLAGADCEELMLCYEAFGEAKGDGDITAEQERQDNEGGNEDDAKAESGGDLSDSAADELEPASSGCSVAAPASPSAVSLVFLVSSLL